MSEHSFEVEDVTVTLKREETARPARAPNVRTVRDPLGRESAVRRLLWPFLAGVVFSAFVFVFAMLVLREASPDSGASPQAAAAPQGAASQESVAQLPRFDASVLIRTVPGGATIWIDGERVGRSPVLERQLAAGRRMVSVRMDGFAAIDTFITARGGEAVNVVLHLTPSEVPSIMPREFAGTAETRREAESPVQTPAPAPPATSRRSAEVAITSEPAGADVIVDGRLIGQTPLRTADLAPGEHEIRLTLPEHAAVHEQIRIRGGESTSLSFALEPLAGHARVLVLPWGDILVNGERLHQATDIRQTYELAAGRHVIRAEHPVLGSAERTIRVIGGETIDVIIDLNP